jgi:hypothetical protein
MVPVILGDVGIARAENAIAVVDEARRAVAFVVVKNRLLTRLPLREITVSIDAYRVFRSVREISAFLGLGNFDRR